MLSAGEDLDLLLSLGEERVLETPPGSPPPHHSSHLQDEGSPKGFRSSDMSVFRDAVKDYLETEPSSVDVAPVPTKLNKPRNSGEVEVEKYSGLRIKNQLTSAVELNNRFSEIRFVRLSVIRNLIAGDTLSGCWATVGVLTEKGAPKMSSSGKSFCVWKMGCLDETSVSVFLFGDAHTNYSKEPVGAVFALFNAAVRKDAVNGFSLSIYTASNMLKIGTSADYGICKGKRKDGGACTMVINKRSGAFCKFHSTRLSQAQRYTTARAELKGGIIRTPYRYQPDGVFMVDPQAKGSSMRKAVQPVKVLSVDGLKKVLSKAEKLAPNSQSQGFRCLSLGTDNMKPKAARNEAGKPRQASNATGIRKASSNIVQQSKAPEAKRKKAQHTSADMIDLDIVSSDDECYNRLYQST